MLFAQQASDLFSSEGGKDLMFSDSASGLIRLPEITDSFLFLKKDYYDIMSALKGDKATEIKNIHFIFTPLCIL